MKIISILMNSGTCDDVVYHVKTAIGRCGLTLDGNYHGTTSVGPHITPNDVFRPLVSFVVPIPENIEVRAEGGMPLYRDYRFRLILVTVNSVETPTAETK